MFGTRKVLEEIRELSREIRELSREIREFRADNLEMLRFTGEVIRRNELAFIESRDELRDLRAESQAQRRALLAVIDRLEGGGAAPAT